MIVTTVTPPAIDAAGDQIDEYQRLILEAFGRALDEEAELTARLAQELVPIETGALQASAIVGNLEQRGDSFKTFVSFGGGEVDYATLVHEDLATHHPDPPRGGQVLEPGGGRADPDQDRQGRARAGCGCAAAAGGGEMTDAERGQALVDRLLDEVRGHDEVLAARVLAILVGMIGPSQWPLLHATVRVALEERLAELTAALDDPRRALQDWEHSGPAN